MYKASKSGQLDISIIKPKNQIYDLFSMGPKIFLPLAPFSGHVFCLSYDTCHVSMHKHKHLSRLMLENEKARN